MDTEFKRLATYSKLSASINLRPNFLARRGLYYDNTTDALRCFGCSFQLFVMKYFAENSTGGNADIDKQHKDTYPSCQFVKERGPEKENVKPPTPQTENVTDCSASSNTVSNNIAGGRTRLTSGSIIAGFASSTAPDPRSNSPRQTSSPSIVVPPGRSGTVDSWPALQQNITTVDSRQGQQQNIATVDGRLAQQQNVTTPELLDEDYYQFPQQSAPGGHNPDRARTKNPGNHQIRHRNYDSESKRFMSFNNKQYVPNFPLANPGTLAHAGFFHQGPRDNVRCFSCDGGLKNFQPEDDPWLEHARWFPDCPFVVCNRDYIEIRRSAPSVAMPAPSNQPNLLENSTNATTVDGLLPILPVTSRAAPASFNTPGCNGPGQIPRPVNQSVFAPAPQGQAGSLHTDEPHQAPPSLLATGGADVELTLNVNRPKKNKKVKKPKPTPNLAADQSSGTVATYQRNGTELESLDDETKELLEENAQLREARQCKVCLDVEVNTVFLPCGHLVCCNVCAPELRNCPVCRALIRGTVRIVLT